jgi:hypothetical protein
VLRGWQLNAFGAFFSRTWRENDYLWGRLNAADRLVDIVASTLGAAERGAIDTKGWKGRLFAAILESEAARLADLRELIDRLKGELTAWSRD